MSDTDNNQPQQSEGEDRANETAQNSTGNSMDGAPRNDSLEAELADVKDKLLRALAETENVRRRLEREREDVAKFAVSKFAQNLLPVADNMRRAIEAVPAESKDNDLLQKLIEGIEATERSLHQAFEKAGISKIEVVDQPFDANYHEVMVEMENPDKTPGTILQQFETGYMIHGRLLRPSRVAVAKGVARERLDTSA